MFMAPAKPEQNRSVNFWAYEAFSLTELLVVIAILVIIAALLIPAITQAKTKTQASVCLSNVKQWGLAILVYTEDNYDIFPYEGNPGDPINAGRNLQAWYNVLPPLMNSQPLKALYVSGNAPLPSRKSLFTCPNTTKRNPPTPTTTKPFFMYGFNCRLDPNNVGGNWTFNRGQVEQPTKTIILGDSSETNHSTTSGVYAPARHNKHANFTFVDGHSEPVHTNNFWRTWAEDKYSTNEWSKPRIVYWYPFPVAPE
jgi:prepilin-type processing-associated H-X9-DG protein